MPLQPLIRGSVATLVFAGCATITVLSPGTNATVVSPVATDVFWNAQLQPGTLKVVIDPASSATDVTSQFSVPSVAADSHALASLALPPGPHTIAVTGSLFSNNAFSSQSASQSFTVSNGAGRPVTYTETIFNFAPGWPAGSLGNVSFGGSAPQAPNRNVNLIFTFEGNTADVVPYLVPRGCRPNCTNNAVNDGAGFEIVAGTATITIQDAQTHQTIAHATFIPAARVFVSVDNGNGGVGFGSFGALPGDPTFPDHGVEVAYPYAQFRAATTDLKTNYTTNADWALSCAGFNKSPGQRGPGTCNLPYALGTTAGVLTITSNDQQATAPPGTVGATFTTVVH